MIFLIDLREKMRNLLCLSILLSISCFEPGKDTENDRQSIFEGDTQGDCFDGEDNDEDGLIDCDDPGCYEREVCAGEVDTADTGEPEDTDTPEDTGPDLENGQQIHDNTCMGCHASNPDITNVANLTDQEIAVLMENGSGSMPPIHLSEDELTDLIAFLRQEYP